jgi:hypothetical protein
MRYLDAYRYITRTPNWYVNVLLGAVAGLVPVVGPIVFSGYLFELVESMRQTGEEKPREIDFNRLMAYLMRGLWPFLVRLVIEVPVSFVAVLLGLISIFVSIAVFGAISPQAAPLGLLVGYLFLFFWIALFSFVSNVVTIPMVLRAGYNLDFGSAFDMAYLKDFFRRVGKELIVSQLFILVTAIGLGIVGMMVFCVGIYLVVPLVLFAQYHLLYQLLLLYEERGGIPLSFKPYDPGPARTPPPMAEPVDREGIFRPDEPPPARDTNIQT